MELYSSIQLQRKESNGGEFTIFAEAFLKSFDICNLQRTEKKIAGILKRTEVDAIYL